jgi:hypothetical protein
MRGAAAEISFLLSMVLLFSVSAWVWRDATRRNMNPRWAIAVGLMMIVFLPLYLVVRKPVKCSECSKVIPASLSMCDECEQLRNKDDGAREGRIFG